MRAVEASAKTREEAIQNALQELGVEMYEVDKIEILDEGSRGLFGIGSRPVRVKVVVEHLPDLPPPRPERREAAPESRPQQPERDRGDRGERGERDRGGRGGDRRGRDNRRGPQRGESRGERGERSERSDRGERGERGERPQRPEGQQRPENAPKSGRPEQGARPQRGEQGGRPERRQRPGRNDRPQRQERRPERERRPETPRPPVNRQPIPQEELDDDVEAAEIEQIADSEVIETSPKNEAAEQETFAPISDAQGNEAAALLEEIIAKMGIEAKAAFNRTGDGTARISVESQDGAILIGRKGRNLSAMQYLINRVISRGDTAETSERIVVDVEGYVERRREALENMARGLAERAKELRRNMRLKPMTPQERRIIHVTLQDDPDVRTFSLGESLYRSVVISPKNAGDQRSGQSRGRGGRGGRGRDRRPRDHYRDAEVDAGQFGD